jgi:hypothetical protein
MTGISYASVRVILTKLKSRGLVTNPSRGLWAANPAELSELDEETSHAESEHSLVRGLAVVN